MSVIKLKPVDVVVVGMGVAGTIVSKELAQSGRLSVVGLDRGRIIDREHEFATPYAYDELHSTHHTDLMQDLSRETITFRNSAGETALPMRQMGSFMPGECVGGSAVRWGGLSWRFLPWEFLTRSLTVERYGKKMLPMDCTSQDWGITYDDLEPYYDQFEYLYGIGGKAGNLNGEIQPGGNPYEGWRTREFPNPPTIPTFAGKVFSEAARSCGYKPFPVPTAAMTQQYKNPYRLMLGACSHAGFCARYGCAMDAKASPLNTVLPALLKHENFELRARANVIKVNTADSAAGKRAIGVTYIDARGREIEQPADLVVLTSFTFSNTRLMLLSGISTPYDPKTGNGVVGRNYAYQPTGTVQLYFNDKVFNRFIGGGGHGVAIDEFNGDNFDHAGLDFIGGAYINVMSMGATPNRSHPVPLGSPRWGMGWKQAVAKYYDRFLQIRAEGCCQSYHTNYLDLDPTYRDALGLPLLRMTFDWREQEIAMSRYTTTKAAEIAKAIGPAVMEEQPVNSHYSIVPYQNTHNTGGVIMGADPATSVVNRYLQSWDIHNLFVIGASAFPQNSASNPTATVGALACWAADAIKEEYLKRPGPLA